MIRYIKKKLIVVIVVIVVIVIQDKILSGIPLCKPITYTKPRSNVLTLK